MLKQESISVGSAIPEIDDELCKAATAASRAATRATSAVTAAIALLASAAWLVHMSLKSKGNLVPAYGAVSKFPRLNTADTVHVSGLRRGHAGVQPAEHPGNCDEKVMADI